MHYDAVIFDAAETLFTTRGSVGEIYGAVARRYGSSVPGPEIHAAFLRQFRHSGPLTTENEKQWWRDIVHRVFSDVGMIDDFDRFFDEVYEQFRDSRGWVLFPETRDVLADLKQRRLKLGVISNFDSRLYSVLQSLDILSFFDSITISSETGFAKPDREIFLAAIRDLAVPAPRALFVGDSLHDDVLAGQSAGLTTVWINRKDPHPASPPVTTIRNLAEILPLLEINT